MADVDTSIFPHLKPSSELISYYRNTISKFEQDFNQINDQLLKFQEISSHKKCEEERERLLKDLLELRVTLSDINVFVQSERQQLYKLTCEKEILEIDNLLCQKKLEVVLDLVDVSQEELNIFLRNSKGKQVLRQKCRTKIRSINEKLTGFSKKPKSVEESALELKLDSWKKQFHESKTAWDQEKSCLLEDRHICKQELEAIVSQNESHTRLLNARLHSAQESLLSANRKFVKMKRDIYMKEQKWLAEKDKMASNIGRKVANINDQLGVMNSNSFTDVSDIDQICKVQMKREMNALKKQLKKEEENRSFHEERCLKAQQELCRLKQDNSEMITEFRANSKKMQERINLKEKQHERLIKWKTKQHEGFLSDIKLLRQQIKTVIHQLFKLTSYCNRNGIELDSEALGEIKSVASLVRKVHHSILESRKSLYKNYRGCDDGQEV